MQTRLITIGGLVWSLLVSPVWAKEPAPAALVERALDHLLFRSRGAEMTLRLEVRSKNGELRTRTLFSRSRKVDGLGRSLVRVLSPSDVAGTAFLFVEKKASDDEQYIYLPALKVVRRIVGEQRRASFMGSDFSYADLAWADLEGAVCQAQAKEKIGAHLAHVIDCAPARRETYLRLRVFVRQRDGVPLRVQFYDQRGEVKVMFVKELKVVDQVLMATALRMVNRRTGQLTELQINNIRVRDDLSPAEFTPQALRQR